MHTYKSSLKASIASLLLLTVPVHATDFDWNAAVNGDWSDTTKWSPSGAPSVVGDNAVISATGSAYEVSLVAPLTLGNLTLDSADATLNLGAFDLAVRTGVADGGAGAIAGSGGRLLIGDASSSGNIVTEGPVFKFGDADIGDGNVVIERGRIEISSDSTGVGTIRVNTAILIGDLKSGQVLDITSNDSFSVKELYSSTSFANEGEIRIGIVGGDVHIATGTTYNHGTLTNTGVIKVIASSTAGFYTDLINNGSVLLEANSNLQINTTYADPHDVISFTNNSSFTIEAGAQVNFVGLEFKQLSGALNNQGSFQLGLDSTFHFNGGTMIGNAPILHGGILSIASNSTGTGSIRINGNSTLVGNVKSGQILEVGASSILQSSAGFTNGGEIHLSGGNGPASDAQLLVSSGVLNNTGTLKVINNSIAFVNADLTNNGNVLVETGGEFTFDKTSGDYLNNADFTIIGKLVVSNAGSLWNGTAGTLRGTGTVEIEAGSSFTNAGTIAPGLSPGTLTIMGDVPFESTASLEIELGGISNYDLLHVLGGDVFLDGMLELALINGFTPGYNDIFTILMADNITGTFDNISGNMVSLPGGSFEVVQSANQLQLIHYVPEPASGLLILLGSTAFTFVRRRRKSSNGAF